jgi:hypothetical protein
MVQPVPPATPFASSHPQDTESWEPERVRSIDEVSEEELDALRSTGAEPRDDARRDDAIADVGAAGRRADGSRADGTGQGPDTDDADGFSAG